MNHIFGKFVLLVLIIFTTTACSPKLSYKRDLDDPASPDDKELVFSLRNSTILISSNSAGNEKKSGDGKQADDQADFASPTNSCTKQEINNNILDKCLAGVNAKAIAAREKSFIYVAEPNWFTTIVSTSIDTDPFMVKKISVNYKNPAAGIIVSAGAGAVTGFGIGGPWGAAIGGIIAAAGQVSGVTLEKTKPPWYENVCEEEKKIDINRFKNFSDQNKETQLLLPVTIDFVSSASMTTCWHPLPNRSSEAINAAMQNPQKPELLSGWFYRIRPGKSVKNRLPPVLPADLKPGDKMNSPFQERDAFFETTGYQKTFPVSACRSIELQITWWKFLNDVDQKKGSPVMYGYQMIVADPDYVQAVRIPKNGTINLLPVCGGYESPTLASSSLGDIIDALVKQAQAVKEAQNKYNDSKDGGGK